MSHPNSPSRPQSPQRAWDGDKKARTLPLRPSVIVAGVIVSLFLVAFVALGWARSRQGQDTHGYPSEIDALAVERPGALAEAQARGREVYEHYCSICHGTEGQGDGPNSSLLESQPRDFTDPEFWKQTTDERIFFAVSQGGSSVGKSVLMPAWGLTLTNRQLRDAITLIRTFSRQPGAKSD